MCRKFFYLIIAYKMNIFQLKLYILNHLTHLSYSPVNPRTSNHHMHHDFLLKNLGGRTHKPPLLTNTQSSLSRSQRRISHLNRSVNCKTWLQNLGLTKTVFNPLVKRPLTTIYLNTYFMSSMQTTI